MSAPEDLPPPGELDPEELELIAEAFRPLNDASNVGSAAGNMIQEINGPGTDLVGSFLQNQSDMFGAAGSTLEVGVNILRVQQALAEESIGTVFPPPHVAARQFSEQFRPLVDLIAEGPQPPEGP